MTGSITTRKEEILLCFIAPHIIDYRISRQCAQDLIPQYYYLFQPYTQGVLQKNSDLIVAETMKLLDDTLVSAGLSYGPIQSAPHLKIDLDDKTITPSQKIETLLNHLGKGVAFHLEATVNRGSHKSLAVRDLNEYASLMYLTIEKFRTTEWADKNYLKCDKHNKERIPQLRILEESQNLVSATPKFKI